MSVIPIRELPCNNAELLLMNKRAIADMIHVYRSNMFINEKNYTMRLIENLRKMGYYRNIESIFTRLGEKNEQHVAHSIR